MPTSEERWTIYVCDFEQGCGLLSADEGRERGRCWHCDEPVARRVEVVPAGSSEREKRLEQHVKEALLFHAQEEQRRYKAERKLARLSEVVERIARKAADPEDAADLRGALADEAA